MVTNSKSIESSENNNIRGKQPRYTLDNPPSLSSPGFLIEYAFLRDLKVGKIPNLEQYLEKLIAEDWTCLLAHNPRTEFLYFLYKLDKEIIAEIGWRYVIETIKSSSNK
jgi:hypothetical protein